MAAGFLTRQLKCLRDEELNWLLYILFRDTVGAFLSLLKSDIGI